MKRATVKQQAEAYAQRRCDRWNAVGSMERGFIAGYRAAQRAARKTQKGKTK